MMKIVSSEIQMATVNLNQTNQSGSSVNQVQELIQDKVTLSQEQTLTTFLIDEMGYVEVEPIQVGLFFTLMHNRHKKKTTLITSNLGFDQWTSFLKNEHLTAALIDRLTENSHVINMKNCVSLRSRFSDP